MESRVRKQRHDTANVTQCPIEAALDLIGGKWKGVILFRLLQAGTLRFGELQRLLCKITQRTLTQQLRELEADGLVHRKVYAQVPPRVEYSLTERGRSLEQILTGLKAWGTDHVLGVADVSRQAAE
jgi:DNA-binding HxlR family transcriptional regulator